MREPATIATRELASCSLCHIDDHTLALEGLSFNGAGEFYFIFSLLSIMPAPGSEQTQIRTAINSYKFACCIFSKMLWAQPKQACMMDSKRA